MLLGWRYRTRSIWIATKMPPVNMIKTKGRSESQRKWRRAQAIVQPKMMMNTKRRRWSIRVEETARLSQRSDKILAATSPRKSRMTGGITCSQENTENDETIDEPDKSFNPVEALCHYYRFAINARKLAQRAGKQNKHRQYQSGDDCKQESISNKLVKGYGAQLGRHGRWAINAWQ